MINLPRNEIMDAETKKTKRGKCSLDMFFPRSLYFIIQCNSMLIWLDDKEKAPSVWCMNATIVSIVLNDFACRNKSNEFFIPNKGHNHSIVSFCISF